jgi:hypothetical protein
MSVESHSKELREKDERGKAAGLKPQRYRDYEKNRSGRRNRASRTVIG